LSETDYRLDVCPECKVREQDGSEKKLRQCPHCERWFCEKHLEPKLAVFRDFETVTTDKEWRNMVEKDRERDDGHPDYEYTQIKSSELDVAREGTMLKIKVSLENSRAYRKPTFGILRDIRNGAIPEAARINREKPSRFRRGLRGSWKSRNLLLSLKLWLPFFLIVVVLLSLMERDNPAMFYRSIPESVKYVFYIFASIIGVWSGYRVFDKCDYSPSSERGIFALRLLSGALLLAGIFILVFGIFLAGGLFTRFQLSLARETTSAFLIVLSFVVIITSAYLVFKFERRSGIIVYRR
jgi:hypothetical protein